MITFVLIHGVGDVGWYWHQVESELRARGHGVVAPTFHAVEASPHRLHDFVGVVRDPTG